MISLPDLLRRLRRAWAPPGPALARIAPPTDVAARLKTEVQPVLDAIAELQRATAIERKKAEAEAEQVLEEATRRADAKVREADHSAPDARAAAAKRRHEAVDEEIRRVLDASETEAARIETASDERLAQLAQKVAECVLSGADILP